MRSIVLAATLIVSFQVLPAHAKDRLSFTVGINTSTADNIFLGGRDLNLEPPPTLDPEGTFSGASFRVGVQYLIMSWIEVEAGYSRFGRENSRTSHFIEFGCVEACPPGVGVMIDNVEQRGDAAWGALMPGVRHGDFRFFGKLGFASSAIESRQATDPTNRWRHRESDVLLGAGAAYMFSHNVGVQIDIERFGDRAHQYGVSMRIGF